MRSVSRRKAGRVLIAATLLLCLTLPGRSQVLKESPGYKVRSSELDVAARDTAGLWKVLDASADRAYQEQTYQDSAAVCLTAYLFASAIEDQEKMYRSAWMMAFSYHFQGNADLALAAYRLALDNVIPGHRVDLNDDGNDSRIADLDTGHFAAKTLLNVAVLCTNARKMDSAERYFCRVVNLSKMEQAKTEAEGWFIKHMLARAQSGLADLNSERFIFDKAIPLYEASRQILEAEYDYSRFRELEPGRRLPLRERMGVKIDLAHCLGSLGATYFDQSTPNLVAARKNLEASLRLREELRNNVYIADSQTLLSKLELAERNYEVAYTLASSAAKLTAPGSDGDNPDLHWQALLAEGQSLLKLDRLDEATGALSEAIETVEAIKNPDLGNEEKSSFFNSITWFFRQKVSPYVTMAEVLIQQGKPFEALRYAELAKARTLLLGRPGLLKQQDSLGTIRVAEDELSRVLEVVIPDQKTAVLEYVRGLDDVYLFLITRDAANGLGERVTAHRLGPLRQVKDANALGPIDDLDEMIVRFRKQIEKSYAAYPRSLGETLYASLVKPIETELASKDHLIVVPTGRLWELPFQALALSNSGQIRYLAESYCVSYTPSLLFLNEVVARSKNGSTGRKTLILQGFTSGEPALSNSTAALVGHNIGDIESGLLPLKSLSGSEATSQQFLHEAPGNALIVIATHAILGGSDPTQSYFALGPDEHDHLTATTIMSEQLAANLVLLIGCETELGRYVEGESEIGLGWAFLYAGCSSTLVSQWKIDRDASLELTSRFCRALAGRLRVQPKVTSLADLLRSTQLALLSDERYSHPFYWAGMVLVGDPYWRIPAGGAPDAGHDRQ